MSDRRELDETQALEVERVPALVAGGVEQTSALVEAEPTTHSTGPSNLPSRTSRRPSSTRGRYPLDSPTVGQLEAPRHLTLRLGLVREIAVSAVTVTGCCTRLPGAAQCFWCDSAPTNSEQPSEKERPI